MNIHELSASEIVTKIKSRELSAKEVAQTFLNRIEQVNPKINAIVEIHPEQVLHQAELADNMVKKNESHLGALHGLPITIKDSFFVEGFNTSKGFPPFCKKPASQDATAVKRLKSAGAIILGITNVPELLVAYESDNNLYGKTNNPYDLTRVAGGSSGGEGAIIAAGGSPLGLGSDAGGSVRQPAHCCGISAHKPTQGLVPYTGDIPMDGLAGLISQILTTGPMARHVEDLNLALNIIAGPDGCDPHIAPVKIHNYKEVNINLLNVAYFLGNKNLSPDKDTENVLLNVIKLLNGKVKSIKEDVPPIDDIFKLHWETFFYYGDKAFGLKKFFELSDYKNCSTVLKEFVEGSEQCEYSVTELRQRLIEVELFRWDMMRYMQNYDVIISPVATQPAFHHHESAQQRINNSYLSLHNVTGWPATVIPVGYSKDGLPIGIQIAAKKWCDHICFALAHEIQNLIGVFPVRDVS